MGINDCVRCHNDMGDGMCGYDPEFGAICLRCWAEIPDKDKPGLVKVPIVVADVMEDDAMTKIANDALALLDEALELVQELMDDDFSDYADHARSIDLRRDHVLRRYTGLRIKAGVSSEG